MLSTNKVFMYTALAEMFDRFAYDSPAYSVKIGGETFHKSKKVTKQRQKNKLARKARRK